jgi:hypothetical protein
MSSESRPLNLLNHYFLIAYHQLIEKQRGPFGEPAPVAHSVWVVRRMMLISLNLRMLVVALQHCMLIDDIEQLLIG